MSHFKSFFSSPLLVVLALSASAQVVDVDVNWNIEHVVGGVSDFGRERHITVHSSLIENDWNGEEDKLDYLMNDLDVYFGRDNGSAGWKFQATVQDPVRPNKPDLDYMVDYGEFLKEQYDLLIDRKPYEARQTELIMGTNPHPLYPTLSWYPNGYTWDDWQPQDVETSAEWVVQYLDKYFRRGVETSGEKLPKYWEVVNEPDMLLMTGSFMVSNWESIWEYHNRVATGVRERLGADAPLIGGMTWGLHDLWQGDLSRYDGQFYYDLIYNANTNHIEGAERYRDAGTTAYPTTGAFGSWEQWDVIWKGFIDHAGTNMDFYAVHLYDWPAWSVAGDGHLRAGGAVEATLDTLEWYDVHTFGKANRKPVVVSEYGAVGPYQDQLGLDPKRRDWENMKPFNSMLMQLLERPDYVVKSMPFTVIKATWGDYTVGSTLYRYPYTMLDETSEGSGVWEWSEYIKFYELWSDVDGTRIDTKAADLDIQVDAYVDGNNGYLILNNLERTNKTVKINAFGGNAVSSVRVKHLYLDGSLGAEGQPALDDQTLQTAPGSVTIGAEATMILHYTFASPMVPDQTAIETKFYGESLSGTTPFRVAKSDSEVLTAQINNVTVPTGPAEATLRISGLFWYAFITSTDPRNQITINGNALDFVGDWRGEMGGKPRWFGTMEVPVPAGYLQANNTITCKVLNLSTYSTVSLQVSEFSQAPGRSATAANVPVTGVSLSQNTLSLPEQRMASVQATIAPANASDQRINWSSSNPSVATVDELGMIHALAAGSATITATTEDGGHTDTNLVTVTSFVPFAVTGIRVNPSVRVLRIGETGPLTETVLPSNAGNVAVTWSSDTPGVATVNSTGLVTAVAEGTATVTAMTADGGFTDTTLVTVPPPIAVTGVSLSPPTSLIAVGDTLQLTPSVSPSGAANQSATWSSDNPAAAGVSGSGVVSGVAEGTASIVVTTVDGGFTATNETTVFAIGPGGAMLMVEAEDFIATGGVSNSAVGINWVQSGDWAEYSVVIPEDGIYRIEYLIATPTNNAAIEFQLDGAAVAYDVVPNTGGWDTYVPLVAEGYVYLTSGSHVVRLVAASAVPWQWNLDQFSLTKVGSLPNATAPGSVLVPYTMEGASLVFGVTNGMPNGPFDVMATTNLMTPIGSWTTRLAGLQFDAAGAATVTNPVSGEALFLQVSEEVTGPPVVPVTGVSLSPPTASVEVGQSTQLNGTVTPANATDKSVAWTSSMPAVATVSANGLVTGVDTGSTVVTVTTMDGGYTDTSTITVVTNAPQQTALFDFARTATDWGGPIHSPSTSGSYFLDNTGPGGINVFIMQMANEDTGASDDYLQMFHSANPVDSPHIIKTVFTVQDAGDVNQTFTVTSLNWQNAAGYNATITGYSGGEAGTEEWTLSGTAALATLVTAATSGSFGNPIDTIVWSTPAYNDNDWGDSILDNLAVSVNGGS